MQLENFIQFVVRYNAQIIEGLLGLIVLSVLFLAYRSFRAAKEAELHPASAVPALGELEETLKKVLERASAMPVAAEGAGGADAGPLLEEIAALKKSLESKQAEIETLKSAPTTAPESDSSGMGEAERVQLESQIKDLQAKLTEYEIISEDIADLSHYKEENARLQRELESMKSGAPAGASASAAAPTPAAAPEAVVEVEVPAPVPEAETAPAPEAAVVEAMDASVDLSELTPAPTGAPAPVVDDDIMKEFAAAVEEQKNQTGASLPVAEAPVAVEPAGDAKSEEPAVEAKAEEPAGLDLGEMDMDKMVAEAMGLENVKAEAETNALEASVDPNKLLEEAASMESIKPDDAQLMGDFENFVKTKGGA